MPATPKSKLNVKARAFTPGLHSTPVALVLGPTQAAKLVRGRTRAHRLSRPRASSFASSVGDQFSSNALSFVSDSHPHNDKLVAQVPPPVPKASAEEVSPVLTAKEAVDKQTQEGDKQTPAEKPVSAHACALSVVSPGMHVHRVSPQVFAIRSP